MKFKEAIHNNYFFEMFVEDLPMWGYVGDFVNEDLLMGEVEGSKTYLFPHLQFHLGFNNDQIVSAKVTTDVRIILDDACFGERKGGKGCIVVVQTRIEKVFR